MSLLFPRLLESAAIELHERLRTLSHDELERLAASGHRSSVFAATGGRRISPKELADLRGQVLGSAKQFDFPKHLARRDRSPFDVALARLLHERSGMVAAEAAARPVWAFLALVLLPDIAYWRFPDPPADRVLATDITRHVFGRLWWRAHLLHYPDDEKRAYELIDVFGEAAFDQIFARRRALGGSRALVRALARAWAARPSDGDGERELLRDVLKRLLRLTAFVDFESLDEPEVMSLVEHVTALSTSSLSREGRRYAIVGPHDVSV